MMQRFSTMRAAALLAVSGALALAGCGGGGHSSSLLPSAASASGGGTTSSSSGRATASMTISGLPATTGTQSSTTMPSSLTRSKQYIDTTTQNSALVVTVTPQDPAEATQYGTITVCYNLFTNGSVSTTNPAGSFTYTPAVVGPPAVPSSATIYFPAPPGTDGFQITQYAGQCNPTSQLLPVVLTSTTAPNGGILSQTPVVYAALTVGGTVASNNINQLVGNCTPQPTTTPAPGYTCPNVPGPPATITSSIAISSIAFGLTSAGTIPITSPVREQQAFVTAGGQIGVPIPLEALNAAGTVVAGLTTPTNATGGSGPFPAGVTVTSNDTTGHTKLYLIDAKNGAIAQAAASNATGITIHEFNALSANTTTGLVSNCGANGTSSCNDITFGGSTAAAGDPWVIVMTFDGTDAAAATPLTSVVVSASAIIPPASTATTINTTITPQSAVYSAAAAPNAGNTGYTDAANPVAPVGLIQPLANGSVYFTDGNKVKIDNGAASAATGTSLTGLTYAAMATPMIYAVDSSVTGGTGTNPAVPSGLYAFNPGTLAVTPVIALNSSGKYVQFKNPVGVVYAPDLTAGGSKLYVMDGNGIEIVDVDVTQTATNVGPCSGATVSTAGTTYLGTAALSSGSASFLVADPNKNQITQIAVSQFACTATQYAGGGPFVGLTPGPTAGSYYASSTTGQIYYIAGAGVAGVSLGLKTGTPIDGPVGVVSATGGTAPSAVNYLLQFEKGSFFDNTNSTVGIAAPYTLQPFAANPPASTVFGTSAPVGIGLRADTSAGLAGAGTPTGVGTINATGGLLYIPSTAAASAVITPGSFLFTDSAKTLRTLVL